MLSVVFKYLVSTIVIISFADRLHCKLCFTQVTSLQPAHLLFSCSVPSIPQGTLRSMHVDVLPEPALVQKTSELMSILSHEISVLYNQRGHRATCLLVIKFWGHLLAVGQTDPNLDQTCGTRTADTAVYTCHVHQLVDPSTYGVAHLFGIRSYVWGLWHWRLIDCESIQQIAVSVSEMQDSEIWMDLVRLTSQEMAALILLLVVLVGTAGWAQTHSSIQTFWCSPPMIRSFQDQVAHFSHNIQSTWLWVAKPCLPVCSAHQLLTKLQIASR